MTFTQLITRSSVAALALLNVSLASSAIATPITVTRGPNGAAHVVKSNNIPVDAKMAPTSEARQFPTLVQKGPGGAAHIVKTTDTMMDKNAQASVPNLIQRGPN
ncbi:MAG: hypothetical protein HC810_01580, partial [Acaryochloridaceae cyanobacterium RL_2_7]|nr:hypothetical protein [Acaryochloridaceae cyanobacterium RL_2_7]